MWARQGEVRRDRTLPDEYKIQVSASDVFAVLEILVHAGSRVATWWNFDKLFCGSTRVFVGGYVSQLFDSFSNGVVFSFMLSYFPQKFPDP